MLPFLSKKLSNKAGAAPGVLMHIGDQKVDQVLIDLVRYDPEQFKEQQVDNIAEALDLCNADQSSWLNINGLHDTELISKVGAHFQIHSLTLEDILNTFQRPKIEAFQNYLYIVFSMLRYDEGDRRIFSEQVSLILTEHALISFQETVGDVFDPVRQRLRNNQSRIRKGGSDYLAYTLMDAVVDHYFTILEKIGCQAEQIEEAILKDPEPEMLHDLHERKREVILLRKQIWPLREMINTMIRDETQLVHADTRLFLRDVYDHTIQIIETIESFRDLLSSLLDLYLSINSNKMNEVMKVLTIIATIFIPITFIAGVYGMNFKYMPELEWPWGYGLVWGIMTAMAIALLTYFKHKRWL
jgi:magnesium transporter